jgi:predicted RNase H-like HicB family nuclease
MATRYYLAIAEPGPENWSISFPAFPGAVTVADTFSGLLMHVRDALASVIDAMQQDGEPVPDGIEAQNGMDPSIKLSLYRDPRIVMVPVEVESKSTRINVTMDEGLVARLDSLAARVHSSRSAILARGARLVLAAETQD